MAIYKYPGAVILITLLSVSLAQTISKNEAELFLDGNSMGTFPYSITGSQLTLPLAAFSSIGWKPLIDPYNRVIDLASCIRIGMESKNVYSTGGLNLIGVVKVSRLQNLPIIAHNRQGIYYLPIKSVLNYLNYSITFDKSSNKIYVSRPVNLDNINPSIESCLKNIQ